MLVKNRNKLFWLLQTIGWFGYVLFYMVVYSGFKFETPKSIFLFSLTYVLGYGITVLLRYPYRIVYKRVDSIVWYSLIIPFTVLIAAGIWYAIDISISSQFWDLDKVDYYKSYLNIKTIFRINYLFLLILVTWSVLYFGIKYWIDWKVQKERAEEAVNLARQAQFEMLRYQLNPHFLFNSLNSIRALVDEDKKATKEMITELSEFLRYSLLNKDLAFVPLKDEIRAMEHYFSIEKKRFEDKLDISFDIDDKAQSVHVISFILHPLVENAVKYGMKTSKMPLKISISAILAGKKLKLKVCNSGKWVESFKESGTGTGLSNVRKRLENAYPDNYSIDIDDSNQSVCVAIEILTNGK